MNIEFNIRSRKRSRIQIFIDVLRIISSGEYKPTRIMHKSNLSWIPLQQILNRMVELNLIRRRLSGTHRYYFITDKGRAFLEAIDGLKKTLTSSPISFLADLDSVVYPFSIIGSSKTESRKIKEKIKLKQEVY